MMTDTAFKRLNGFPGSSVSKLVSIYIYTYINKLNFSALYTWLVVDKSTHSLAYLLSKPPGKCLCSLKTPETFELPNMD